MNIFSKIFIVGALAFTGLCSYAHAQDKTVYEVTAASIAKEFEANQLKAEKKYKDNPFVIKGKVESVDKNHEGKISIGLKGDYGFAVVNAYILPQAIDKASELDENDVVKLRCLSADEPIMVTAYSCEFVD